MVYNPKNYWEKRLSDGFVLSKVGHIGFSEYYNKWLYKAKIRALKKALSLYRIEIDNKTICDIGCGTGFFVEFYKHLRARDIIGIDITSTSVKNLKLKYPEYNFIKADISSNSVVSKVNRKFDILDIFDVMYHITDDKLFNQAIANIYRLTNPGGFVLITDRFCSKNIQPAEHVKFRSKKTYENVLSKNGFEIITILPLYYLLNRPIFGKFHHSGIKADNLFAPIYYFLDKLFISQKGNLKLIVVKKVKL